MIILGLTVLARLNNVLNPNKLKVPPMAELGDHGKADLQFLCDRLALVPSIEFEAERAKQDFLMYKMHARSTQCVSLKEFAKELCYFYFDTYPDFCILMQYLLVVPLNSASCERGFSVQNMIKTKNRNRLGEGRLDALMRVCINGPDLSFTGPESKSDADYFEDAAQHFRSTRNRKM